MAAGGSIHSGISLQDPHAAAEPGWCRLSRLSLPLRTIAYAPLDVCAIPRHGRAVPITTVP